MPRLADVGTFLFHSKAKVSKEILDKIKEMKAIDIIFNIMNYKFSRNGKNNRLYLLNGRTGSGKSTYFLSKLYERFIVGSNSKIVCSQPQVVLTESNARDIINYSDGWKLGGELGVHSSKMYIRGNVESINFYTTQILNDELMRIMLKPNIENIKKDFRRIKFIIIDEVHTLDIPMISTLKVLRDLVNKYGDLQEFPIIIFASATMDVEALSKYFSIDLEDPFMCAIISGSPNYDVEEIYLTNAEISKFNAYERTKQDTTTSYLIVGEYFMQHIYPSMLKDDAHSRDALIFVPGHMGIQTISTSIGKSISELPAFIITKGTNMNQVIKWRNSNRNVKRVLIIGFSTGFADASDQILSNSEDSDKEALQNELKIIIATTALETGKTLYHLKYVIDMGLQTSPMHIPLDYDVNNIIKYFRQIPENKNQMIQRKGRVGRVATGKVVHFYTKETENMFLPESIPQTIDAYCLSELILRMLMTKPLWTAYDIPNENDLLYPISADIMIASVNDLVKSGFISVFGVLGNTWHNTMDMTKQRIYAKYMYEVLGYNLFTTSLYSVTNIKELPNYFNILKFRPKTSIQILDNFINNNNPTSQMIEQIRRARGEITLAQYRKGFSFYAYYKDRLF